jgi:hypothetical protein
MSAKKYIAMMNGPGWRTGTIFEKYADDCGNGVELYAPRGFSSPLLSEASLIAEPDWFREYHDKKRVAFYEVEIPPGREISVLYCIEPSDELHSIRPARIEEREA